jgi:hypothetical protein
MLNPSSPVKKLATGKDNEGERNAVRREQLPSCPILARQGVFAQLSKQELEIEYGPVQHQIRLAPTLKLLKEIQEQLTNDPKRNKTKQV